MSAGIAAAGYKNLNTLDRAGLYAHAVHRFRQGGGTEPEVVIVDYEGRRAVLKDYGRGGGWFAWLIGPLLIRREAQALERLAGLPGIPALIRRIDSRGVLMEYVPAEPWPRMQPPAESFDRLHELLASMHARGVAHCDLRAPSNILVDKTGQPYIVDFVARVMRGAGWNHPWAWVFAKFCQADRNALAKLKVRNAPHLATEQERLMAEHRGFWVRFIRGTGAALRSFTRLFVNKNKDAK